MLQVLGLLWNLVYSEDVFIEIMDQVLIVYIKILDYSCLQVISLFLKFILVKYFQLYLNRMVYLGVLLQVINIYNI